MILAVISLGQGWGQVWQPFGLQSEEVSAIAVDPRDSHVIFVGSGSDYSASTYGSVFKTTNAGASWDTLLHGISVNKIILHPWNPDTLFVLCGTPNFSPPGILKTCDGGKSWVWSDSGMILTSECSPFSMAINPANPSIMYAGTGGFGGGSLYKSIDGGRSWFWTPDSMDGSIESIVLDPVHPETLYVGTTGTGPMWESLDGGMHWRITLSLMSGVVDMAVDSRVTNILYALITYSDGGPFARSTDRGKTWVKRRVSSSSQQWAQSFVVDPRRRNVMYTTLTGPSIGIYKSTDQGDTWVLFNEGIQGYRPNVLSIDSLTDMIYLGTIPQSGHPGGVYLRALVTSVKEDQIPKEYDISEAYPNPFNGTSLIHYFIPRREHVSITLWDVLGRRVKNIKDESEAPGRHVVRIDGATISSGVYFVKFEMGRFVQARKLVLLR